MGSGPYNDVSLNYARCCGSPIVRKTATYTKHLTIQLIRRQQHSNSIMEFPKNKTGAIISPAFLYRIGGMSKIFMVCFFLLSSANRPHIEVVVVALKGGEHVAVAYIHAPSAVGIVGVRGRRPIVVVLHVVKGVTY